jgi:hypothetical protein
MILVSNVRGCVGLFLILAFAVVTDGDDDEYGDGTATHVAVFHINEEKIAGLRIICNSDTGPLVIAGAWTQ